MTSTRHEEEAYVILQIGYFSTAAGVQDARTVHDILLKARRDNRRDSITGLLVAGAGRYLHVIEGPQWEVEALYARILADNRHLAVSAFSRRNVAMRSFAGWSMAYRRSTAEIEPNSFVDVLRALTREIPDTDLKHQIRFFAGAVMMDKAA